MNNISRYISFFLSAAACLFLVSCPNLPKGKFGRQYSKSEVVEAVESILPEGWVVRAGRQCLPLIWQGNVSCQAIYLVNPTVTHTEPRGGFDYHPFHEFWLCPPDFTGSQYPIGMLEARYPANYIADGPAGILFSLSLGRNDWEEADEDAARALGLQKPREDPESCKKANNVLADMKFPEGMEIECNLTTRDSLFLFLKTFEEISFEEVDKITDDIVRYLKKAFSDKKRMVISRIHNQNFDAVIVGFKLKIR